MKPDIYWIPQKHSGQLAIMPRPRSGDWLEDELKAWRKENVDVVVSLLTTPEIMELELNSEDVICSSHEMMFITFPIGDRQVPVSLTDTAQLINQIDKLLRQGKNVAIHCRAGIGRSGLISACVLVKQGFDVSAAFETISKARGIEVPDTDEQKAWVLSNVHAIAGSQDNYLF
jgi:protein-tyrosine phosphatase